MRRLIVGLAALAALGACVGSGRGRLAAAPQPAALSLPHVDRLHGVEVSDPYRWLEESESPEVQAWVAGESALTRDVLDALPGRAALRRRLVELSRVETRSLPVTHGAWSYWLENDGTRDQPQLVRGQVFGRAEEVVLDPSEATGAGPYALVDLAFSPHGSFVAYGLSHGGSDWVEWRVRDLETLADCGPGIRRVRFNRPAWTHDEAGFFYGGYAREEDPLRAGAVRMRLAYHRVGQPQSSDEIVHDEPQRTRRGYAAEVTDDGRWLVVTVWEGAASRNRLYVRDLSVDDSPLVPLFDDLDAAYHLVGSRGASLFLRTTEGAPTGRVVRVDAPDAPWVEVVGAGAAPIADALLVGDHVVVERLDEGSSVVEVFTIDGASEGAVELPGRGAIGAMRPAADERAVLLTYSDPTRPAEHWRVELPSLTTTRTWAPDVPFDGERFRATSLDCRSADGTRIPVWLVHPRSVDRPRDLPVVLTGYGGFGVVPRPAFDPAVAAWLERGGGYAVAHVRGGGEFGEAWHLAATGTNKPRSFEDFTAAAEALVASGWTRPSRLGVRGASNGGLLVAASLNLRPELFGAAAPAVGVLDMLRYHRFTVGWSWAGDYGTVEDPDTFTALLAYSPYHNVRTDVPYPPVLVLAAAGDDRVVPLHSYKYVAALRSAVRRTGGGPALLRVASGQGHSATSAAESFAAAVDEWAFFGAALSGSR